MLKIPDLLALGLPKLPTVLNAAMKAANTALAAGDDHERVTDLLVRLAKSESAPEGVSYSGW